MSFTRRFLLGRVREKKRQKRESIKKNSKLENFSSSPLLLEQVIAFNITMNPQENDSYEQQLTVSQTDIPLQTNSSLPSTIQNQHSAPSNFLQPSNEQTTISDNSIVEFHPESTFFTRLWESTKTYFLKPFFMAMAASIGLSIGIERRSFFLLCWCFFPLHQTI
jgi:hypothetical protein